MIQQDKYLSLLLPPGRIVWGDLYSSKGTDYQGKPRFTQNGDPKITYDYAVAIPKNGTTHWSQTPWGQAIYQFGAAKWPQGQFQRPDFAWKIEDGDSTVPNGANRRPCDAPGYPGNWIVKMSSTQAPRIYRLTPTGTQLWDEKDAIKPGDWVEVNVSLASNGNLQKPGVYINHGMVCFRGYDPAGRISIGPDPSSVGFGSSELPAGVSQVPVGQALGAAPAPVVQSPAGFPPFSVAPPQTVATANPPAYAPPALAVGAPAPLPPPPAPLPPPPAPAAPVMTPLAGGVPYAEFIKAGWTDQTLREKGYIQ